MRITYCSGCGLPAHASETDDLDRCAACRDSYGPERHWPLHFMWCVLGALVAMGGHREQVLICAQCGAAWCAAACPSVQATLWAGHPDLVRR